MKQFRYNFSSSVWINNIHVFNFNYRKCERNKRALGPVAILQNAKTLQNITAFININIFQQTFYGIRINSRPMQKAKERSLCMCCKQFRKKHFILQTVLLQSVS